MNIHVHYQSYYDFVCMCVCVVSYHCSPANFSQHGPINRQYHPTTTPPVGPFYWLVVRQDDHHGL